jgi:hypothetical protein
MMLRKNFAGNAVKRSNLGNPALVAFIASLSLAQQFASADTIASSLSNNTTTVGFSPGQWVASPFTTGFQSWQLTNVTVSLLQGGTSPSLADVRLFSDNVGQVGVSLADLGVQTITGFQSQLWSFAASGDIPLAPNTTYWIAVGNVSPDQGLTVSIAQPPFSYTGAPAVSMAFSGTQGVGSGMNPPAVFDPPGTGSALPFQADGTASTVPEPGPLAALLIGGSALLVFRRVFRPTSA